MGSISSLSNNNSHNNNNLKKVVAIVGMIFILFVISEVANATHRRKKVTVLSLRESSAPTATADSLYDVSNANLFSSLDAELEWDRFMILGYDYHQNRENSNNDEDYEGSNPSPGASKRDTERKLFDFNKITSHHLRRRQK